MGPQDWQGWRSGIRLKQIGKMFNGNSEGPFLQETLVALDL